MKTWLIHRYINIGLLYRKMWWAASKELSNKEKRDYVIGFVNDIVDIPFIPAWIENPIKTMVLDWAIDWALARLKPRYGKDWHLKFQQCAIPLVLVTTKRKK